MKHIALTILLVLTSRQADYGFVAAADWTLSDNPELAAFFDAEVQRIEQQNSLTKYQTLEQWQAAKPQLRTQLFSMLGLHPLPERTPLETVITGITDEAEFRVERLHFQSLPGLYVTGNLYVPKTIETPLPAVLYVCGHGNVKQDGISYGSKASYQRHGAWFARNGYVCLIIDTLQLGEIEGIHHGTYRYNRWWWNSRGYTPAGVEAWNGIRALDYLQSRPEVDGSRLGVTGRSGGGAYSWWLSALDERIQCAIPVAGITSLRNHVVDGCVEGHCDCMYMVNTSRWDYATVAALVAPRPLLISNTDKDGIFPLEGVVDIHRQVRHIYNLYGKLDHLGLQITEGPHKDTQELHVHAFRWLNRFLRKDDSMIDKLVQNFFEPEQLRVFAELPTDERNTTIDESFVPEAPIPQEHDVNLMLDESKNWLKGRLQQLRSVCFAAWPDHDKNWQSSDSIRMEQVDLVKSPAAVLSEHLITRVHFESQPHVPLFFDIVHHRDVKPADISSLQIVLMPDKATDAEPFDNALSNDIFSLLIGQRVSADGKAIALFAPRGSGPNRWIGDEKKQIQIQRRFQLLGMTVDGMRTWDIRRAVRITGIVCGTATEISLRSADVTDADMLCLSAALFEPTVRKVYLKDSAESSNGKAVILNLDRVMHPQELLALVLLRTPISVGSQIPNTDLARRLSSDPRWTGQQLLSEE